MRKRVLFLVLAISAAGAVPASGSPTEEQLQQLAATATAAPGAEAERAIAELRACGPLALEPLFAMRSEISTRSLAADDAQLLAAEQRKLESIIDRVAGQLYAHDSHLYWYTDLDAARAAASASGKPILSLRLLGKLTDQYSCANSRFFRTTLYPNQQVAERLRKKFVLHWKTVRPVPRVTIDFGDGRMLERTVTGNSAHYALAADGTPLDVLPGLYGPQQFLAWLDDVERLHADLSRMPSAEREARLREHHRLQAGKIVRRWADDLDHVTMGPLTPAERAASALERATTGEHWRKIALLPEHAVRLDRTTGMIMRRENPAAIRADERAVTKSGLESPILRLMANLQVSIAEDGARNEYMLHRQAHEWFAGGTAPSDVERLNDRVYAELFLTPNSDPWLGLASDEKYTALENDGKVASP
jgi:hypothetical protein